MQQLLYSRKKSELPNSEIKRTNKTPIWHSLLISFFLLLFIASAVLFGIEASGVQLFETNAEWIKYLFLTTSAVLFLSFSFWIIHYRKLTRIKYKDFEIDIRAKDGEGIPSQTASLINKFVDEVLYFFECVDIDLVIFEDLDRLPTTEIFAKLRELNTIINVSKKRRAKVTFLYAAKDDLFKTEEERAKFFEFILPVVPIINPVTTGEELRKQLDKLVQRNKSLELTERFVKGISTYIPNMRILKNTLNDYIIMYSKVFEDSDAKSGYLKQENLFALSLYKNLYPYDYALLEKNAGLIPLVVDVKKLRESFIVSNNQRLKDARNRIDVLKDVKLKSILELKFLFAGITLQFRSQSRYYSNESQAKNIFDEDFSFIGCNFNKIMHPAFGQSNHYIELPNGEKEVFLPNGDRFADRESLILEKFANGENATKALIAKLEKEREEI